MEREALEERAAKDLLRRLQWKPRQSLTVAQYECYHIVVTNVPAGASGQVYINATQYGFTFPGGGGGSGTLR